MQVSPFRRPLVVTTLLALVAAPVCADDLQARFFDELRARRLYALAERGCLERLAAADLSPAQRADLTLELSRTFAEHTAAVPLADQAELWSRAAEVIAEFLKTHPDNPRRLLLEVQAALLPVARGQGLRWQAELRPEDAALRQQALQQLQQGAAALAELERRLEEIVKKPPRPATDAGELQPYEIRSQLYFVRYQLGVVFLDQAELWPGDAPDRATCLADAERWLAPLAEGFPGEEITWRSWVALARIARMGNDAGRALAILDNIQKADPPPAVLDAVVTERIRARLAKGEADEAARLAFAHQGKRSVVLPEMAFLGITALSELTTRTKAKDAALAAELQREVDSRLARLRSADAGYWTLRTELTLERSRETQEFGPEVAAAIRKASAAYAAGDRAAAVAAYGAAGDAASRGGHAAKAFELRYLQGSILIEQAEYTRAAEQLQALASGAKDQPRSPDAHLLAAYALGKLYDAKPTRPRREAYVQILADHLAAYPGRPSAGEAAFLLGVLEERRLQATKALELYRQVPPTHARFPESQLGVARCFERILERVHELGQPPQVWEGEAVRQLSAWIPTAGKFDRTQAELVVRLARLYLQQQPAQPAKADLLLSRLFDSAPELGDSPDVAAQRAVWTLLLQTASRLRIVSLAGQERWTDAEKLVEEQAQSAPGELLGVLDGLSHAVPATSPAQASRLGALQLKAARTLERDRRRLTPEQQSRLDACLAQAYLATGQPGPALEIYEARLKAEPGNVQLLAAAAARLSDCDAQACQARAATLWKQLERRRTPGTIPWLEARYEQARATLAAGDAAGCRKLVGATRILYPQLGGEEWQQKLADLDEACQAAERRAAP